MLPLFLISLLHIVAGGVVAVRLFRAGNRTELLLTAGLVAYVTFYMVPVGLGWVTTIMNGWTLGAGLVSALGLASWSWFVTRDGALGKRMVFLTALFRGRNPIEWVIWLVLGAVLVLLLMAGMALPVRTWDAPGYHMSNPMRWHMTGRFILDSFGGVELSAQAVSAECAPNIKAVWPFAVMVFTKDIAATCLAQFPFLLLLIMAVRATGLRLGSKPWLASLSALAIVTVPEIFLQSLEAYSDLVFLSGQMVMVWALIYVWQERLSWRIVAYPAVGFGILSGAKASFLLTGGMLGLLYGAILLWKAFKVSPRLAPRFVGTGLLATFACVLFSGGPWYVHAWRKFDNPVFPFEIKIGSRILFDGPYKPTVNDQMLMQYTGFDGKQAYWNTIRETWRAPGLSNWSGGTGAGFFALGIVSLAAFCALGLWRSPGAGGRRVFVMAGLALVASTATVAVARFGMFQPVLGYIAFGWVASRFPIPGQGVAAAWAGLLLFYDAAMSFSSIQYRQRPEELVAYNLLSGSPRAAQRDIFPDQYTALDFWKEEVSRPGLKLGIQVGTTVWYTYAPWSPADLLRFRVIKDGSEIEKLHGELAAAGITHVYLVRNDAAFLPAIGRPDLFKVLIRRLNSQYDNVQDFYVERWPEDVLLEVQRPGLK